MENRRQGERKAILLEIRAVNASSEYGVKIVYLLRTATTTGIQCRF
jgi:hypothetical protein